MNRLPADVFAADAVTVARQLLGQRLLRFYQGQVLAGLITQTEAYVGESDTACHAARGRTPRTEVMYGAAGHYYVYLIYGMYHMLNIVTGAPGQPEAVLIRGLKPLQGISIMRRLRSGAAAERLCDGPGKLCQALAIDKRFNGVPVSGGDLWLEAGSPVNPEHVQATPRIGIGYASPQDQKRPWRFVWDAPA